MPYFTIYAAHLAPWFSKSGIEVPRQRVVTGPADRGIIAQELLGAARASLWSDRDSEVFSPERGAAATDKRNETRMSWQVWLYVTAVLIPLAAFVVEAIFIRQLKRLNAYIATGAIGLSCVLSLIGFIDYYGFHASCATATKPRRTL